MCVFLKPESRNVSWFTSRSGTQKTQALFAQCVHMHEIGFLAGVEYITNKWRHYTPPGGVSLDSHETSFLVVNIEDQI